MRTAFVGLGVMGFPMARHLVQAGHALSVYNRSPQKVQALVEAGGRGADTVADAVRGARANPHPRQAPQAPQEPQRRCA